MLLSGFCAEFHILACATYTLNPKPTTQAAGLPEDNAVKSETRKTLAMERILASVASGCSPADGARARLSLCHPAAVA